MIDAKNLLLGRMCDTCVHFRMAIMEDGKIEEFLKCSKHGCDTHKLLNCPDWESMEDKARKYIEYKKGN